MKENITPFSGEHELLEFDKSITSDRTDSVQGIPVVTSNFAKKYIPTYTDSWTRK